MSHSANYLINDFNLKSCETYEPLVRNNTGEYGMIIPFEWWHKEHPLSNIDKAGQWKFDAHCCKDHSNISEDPEIKIEYDESIVYDPRAQYIGRIQYVPPN